MPARYFSFFHLSGVEKRDIGASTRGTRDNLLRSESPKATESPKSPKSPELPSSGVDTSARVQERGFKSDGDGDGDADVDVDVDVEAAAAGELSTWLAQLRELHDAMYVKRVRRLQTTQRLTQAPLLRATYECSSPFSSLSPLISPHLPSI